MPGHLLPVVGKDLRWGKSGVSTPCRPPASPPDHPPRPRIAVCTLYIGLFIGQKDYDASISNLIDDWTIIATYADPISPIDSNLLKPVDLKTIMLGDFNAKHPTWFDTRASGYRQSLARGAALHAWSRRAHTVERGARLPTRHRTGDIPSKIDLIWTRRDSAHFTIGDYLLPAHSDHNSLHCRLRLIKPPLNHLAPRSVYRRMPSDLICDLIRSSPPPKTSPELEDLITRCLEAIPRISRLPNRQLPLELLSQRRLVRHLMKKRWGSNRYLEARKAYREDLKHFINTDIEESLDSAQGTDFFRFTRRQRVNRPVPSLTLNEKRPLPGSLRHPNLHRHRGRIRQGGPPHSG